MKWIIRLNKLRFRYLICFDWACVSKTPQTSCNNVLITKLHFLANILKCGSSHASCSHFVKNHFPLKGSATRSLTAYYLWTDDISLKDWQGRRIIMLEFNCCKTVVGFSVFERRLKPNEKQNYHARFWYSTSSFHTST